MKSANEKDGRPDCMLRILAGILKNSCLGLWVVYGLRDLFGSKSQSPRDQLIPTNLESMKPKGLAKALLGTAALTVMTSPVVFAQSANWNVDAAGVWSNAANWNPAVVPGNAAGDVVGLTNNITAARTVTIDTTPRIVGTLNIGDADNTHAFTLAASGGGTLTFDNGGLGASLNETGSITDVISAPIILADNLTINASGLPAANSGLNITGVISETGGPRTITIAGTGAAQLSAANTYTGGTILNSGELHIGNSGALGTGTVTINGGAFVARTAPQTLANALVVNSDFTVSKVGFNNQMNFSGTVDLTGGTRTITVADTTQALDTTFSGVISNGGLTKAGTGTMVLTGVNTYTGPTTISAGTLIVDGAGQLGAGTYAGAIANSGTLTLSSTAPQTLSGVISGTGGLNVVDSGAVTLSATNTYTGNTVIGVVGGSSVILATANDALGTGTVSIVGNAGTNRLELSGGITLGNAIVQSGKQPTPTLAAPSIVSVSGANTLTGTVTVQSGGTATAIQSDLGSTLTLSNPTAITSGATGTRIVGFKGAGDIVVSGAITNGLAGTLSVEKLGTGTLTLSSASNTYTGTTTVSEGTLATAATGNLGTGNVIVADVVGATLVLGNSASIADTATLFFASDSTITLNNLLGTETVLTVTETDGDLQSLIAGTYSAGDLNNYFGVTSFGGQGTLTVVPEPSAALLGGLGVLGLLRRRRQA
jgi:fibronectin-binding autotransporter adhesin